MITPPAKAHSRNAKASNMPTIILADDHELIREAVKPYLQHLDEEMTVWEASTYDGVLELAKRANDATTPVSLALIDLHMPGYNRDDMFEALRRVCAALPNTAVMIFSSNEDGNTIRAALKNGARGYIPKTTRGRSLANALKIVLDGDVYIPQALMKEVFSEPTTAETSDNTTHSQSEAFGGLLSAREADSLRFLIQGRSNKEIARELGLQDVTVKMHLRNAYRKIGATNRIDAVRIALEKGFT